MWASLAHLQSTKQYPFQFHTSSNPTKFWQQTPTSLYDLEECMTAPLPLLTPESLCPKSPSLWSLDSHFLTMSEPSFLVGAHHLISSFPGDCSLTQTQVSYMISKLSRRMILLGRETLLHIWKTHTVFVSDHEKQEANVCPSVEDYSTEYGGATPHSVALHGKGKEWYICVYDDKIR